MASEPGPRPASEPAALVGLIPLCLNNSGEMMDQRLIRLEHLVLLIAQQVGVPLDAIARLLPPAAPT